MAFVVKHNGLLSVQVISSGEILPSTFKKVLAQVYFLLVSYLLYEEKNTDM